MAANQPIIFNPAKEKLRRGEPITGINIFEALLPSVVKVSAQAG
jgi:hypothetical protein